MPLERPNTFHFRGGVMNDKNGKVLRAGATVMLTATVLSVSEPTQEKKDASGAVTQGADPGSVTIQGKDGHTIVLPGDVLEVQDTSAQTTGGAAPTSRTGQPGSGVSGQTGTSAAEANGEPAGAATGANRQMIPGSTGGSSSTASTQGASAGASTLGSEGSSSAQGGSASSSSSETK